MAGGFLGRDEVNMMAALASPWHHTKRPPLKAGGLTLIDQIERAWRLRPCWICEARGACGHREFEVEEAAIERSRNGR